MSNLGFNIAMKEHGIEVIAAAVGDRYVLEEMRAGGFTIGGEQSGHVVLSEFATTGDGVLTALHLMSEMKSTGKSMADLAAIVNRLPQVLINVPNVDKGSISNADVTKAVAKLEQELGSTGRILLRPSGTEPLIRVMVEAATAEQAQAVAQELAEVVATHCALS
jgi:phosphoglucosamine mutase